MGLVYLEDIEAEIEEQEVKEELLNQVGVCVCGGGGSDCTLVDVGVTDGVGSRGVEGREGGLLHDSTMCFLLSHQLTGGQQLQPGAAAAVT